MGLKIQRWFRNWKIVKRNWLDGTRIILAIFEESWRKKEKRKELTRVEWLALQGGGSFQVVQLQKEINLLIDKEEKMWRQRSHTLYIKDGDQNTRFFHCRATQRNQKKMHCWNPKPSQWMVHPARLDFNKFLGVLAVVIYFIKSRRLDGRFRFHSSDCNQRHEWYSNRLISSMGGWGCFETNGSTLSSGTRRNAYPILLEFLGLGKRWCYRHRFEFFEFRFFS